MNHRGETRHGTRQEKDRERDETQEISTNTFAVSLYFGIGGIIS